MKNLYYSDNYLDDLTEDTEEISSGKQVIAGSGGGCFPGETLVRTLHGYKQIQKIHEGEAVLTYTKQGRVEVGHVVKVHRHTESEHNNTLVFVYSGKTSLFPKGITDNHAVYNPKTNLHKPIREFSVGDYLEGENGRQYKITRISFGREDAGTVYNLTVAPQHTYFVGAPDLLVKVHNGGGGKGSARAAIEAPDTLQSEATIKVLEVISHGEIEGVVGGAAGVFINKTPLYDAATDSYNFEGITFDQRTGLPSQSVIIGFENVESEISIASTEVTDLGVIHQISTQADAARITLLFPQGLWKQNTTNGDLNGYEVSFEIYRKSLSDTTWSLVVAKTIKDKSSGRWEIAAAFNAPTLTRTEPWQLKVVRTSPADDSVSKKSVFYWNRITEIQAKNLPYNNIAYVGLTVPAKTVGSSIPLREYLVRGLKIQIPTNYDPLTKTYSGGYWDGTFKVAWTDNPAWVLYDLLTNTEYGVANFLNVPLDIDKWSFFEAALYNDCVTWDAASGTYITNLIDDGEGGLEVRHTFNAVMQVRMDAWQLLNAVASNMSATIVKKGSSISILQDKPTKPVRIINNTNVKDGLFSYYGSEVHTRATAVNCTFNDKKDNYLPVTISEQDNTGIAKYGFFTRDVIAYGVTKESEARRLAKRVLYSELYQYDQVAFTMSLNILDLAVGDVINIMDNEYVTNEGDFLTGKILNVSGLTVTLDRKVTLLSLPHTIGITNLDYSDILNIPITESAVITDTVTLTTPLPPGDYSGKEFYCYSAGALEPRPFKILNIKESEKGVYDIKAIFYDENKYIFIDTGTLVPQRSYFFEKLDFVPPVQNVTFFETHVNTKTKQLTKLGVKWETPLGLTQLQEAQLEYIVVYRRNNDKFEEISVGSAREASLDSPLAGVYEVKIYAKVLFKDLRSNPVTAIFNYHVNELTSPLNPPTNLYVKNTVGLEFSNRDLSITFWNNTLNTSVQNAKLLDYIVEILDVSETSVLNYYIVQPNIENDNGEFVYRYEDNAIDHNGTASRDVKIRIKARDLLGNTSVPSAVTTFTNPPVPFPIGTIVGEGYDLLVTIDSAARFTDAEYLLIAVDSQGFTPSDKNIFAEIPLEAAIKGYKIPVPTLGTYYARFGLIDAFGKININWSDEIAVTVDGGNFEIAIGQSATAYNYVQNFTSDGVITSEEKHQIRKDWLAMYEDLVKTESECTLYGVPATLYISAFEDLSTYLNDGTTYTYSATTLVLPLYINDTNITTDTVLSSNSLPAFRAKIESALNGGRLVKEDLANTRKTFASQAQSYTTNLASDLVITKSEATQIKADWENQYHQVIAETARAALYSITTEATNYKAAFENLSTYLNNDVSWVLADYPTLPSFIANLTNFTDITLTSANDLSIFRNLLETLFGSYAALQQAIDSAENSSVLTASSNATTAISYTNNLASDGIISVSEKKAMRSDWSLLVDEGQKLITRANSLGITTESSDYITAFENLSTFLNGNAAWTVSNVATTPWVYPSYIAISNLNTDTILSGTDTLTVFAQKLEDTLNARETLKLAIATKENAETSKLNTVQAGADVTSQNTALAIQNQGVLATANQVTSSTIASNAVTENHVASGAITAAKTAIAAIDPNTGNLTANSVTANNINVGTLSAIAADLGTINAGNIYGSANIDISGNARFKGNNYGLVEGNSVSSSVWGNTDKIASRGAIFFGASSGVSVGCTGLSETSGGYGIYGIATESSGYGGYFKALGTSAKAIHAAGDCYFSGQVTIGGQLLSVGSTATVANLHADNSDKLGGTLASYWCRIITTSSGTAYASGYGFQFQLSGSLTGSYHTSASGNSFYITDGASDRRIKKNIEKEPLGLNFIEKLNPVIFNFKNPKEPKEKQHGLIAQEVEKLIEEFPENNLVTEEEDSYYDVDMPVKKVNYRALTPILIKAVQELSAKVRILEDKLNEKN